MRLVVLTSAAGSLAIVALVMGAATASPGDEAARGAAESFLHVAAASGNSSASALCNSGVDTFTSQVVTGQLRVHGFQYAGGETTFANSTEHDVLFVVRGVPGVRAVDVDVMRVATGWCVIRVVPNPPGRY